MSKYEDGYTAFLGIVRGQKSHHIGFCPSRSPEANMSTDTGQNYTPKSYALVLFRVMEAYLMYFLAEFGDRGWYQFSTKGGI